MMTFSSPEELHQFIGAVIEKLKADGSADAARMLATPHRSVFTTGSEWLGEIGAAVRKVQSTCTVSEEINGFLETIMDAVHKVWPEI